MNEYSRKILIKAMWILKILAKVKMFLHLQSALSIGTLNN